MDCCSLTDSDLLSQSVLPGQDRTHQGGETASEQSRCGARTASVCRLGAILVEFRTKFQKPSVNHIPYGGILFVDFGRWLLAHIIRDKKKMLNRVRRIRGQVESIEHAIEREADCSEILHTISACRGAFNSLMAEVLDGHIRFHVVDPDRDPTSEKARAAKELIDVLRAYVR